MRPNFSADINQRTIHELLKCVTEINYNFIGFEKIISRHSQLEGREDFFEVGELVKQLDKLRPLLIALEDDVRYISSVLSDEFDIIGTGQLHDIHKCTMALSERLYHAEKLILHKIRSVEIRERFQALIAAVQKLYDLFRSLARLQHYSRQEEELIDFTPSLEIKSVIGSLNKQVSDQTIDLVLEVNNEQTLSGRPEFFRDVIRNLLLNSIQALNKKKSPDKKIIIQLSAGPEAVQIRIQDNADGIPADLADRVFDPYFTTSREGSGLGLALSKYLTESHFNGTLVLESRTNPTIFELKITLPHD